MPPQVSSTTTKSNKLINRCCRSSMLRVLPLASTSSSASVLRASRFSRSEERRSVCHRYGRPACGATTRATSPATHGVPSTRCSSSLKHMVRQRSFHISRAFPTALLSPYGRTSKHNLRFARMFQSSPLVSKFDDDRVTGDATIQVDPAGGEKKTPLNWLLRVVGYYGEESVHIRQSSSMYQSVLLHSSNNRALEFLGLENSFYGPFDHYFACLDDAQRLRTIEQGLATGLQNSYLTGCGKIRQSAYAQ